MELYVKMSFISTFSPFLLFKRDFIRRADFTSISASNTVSDDVKIRSHIEYLIQPYYIFVLIF